MHVITELRVRYKSEIDEKLDAAVQAALSDSAVNGGRGVVVTRHDFGHFSVALSADVPFGLIQELDLCRRN